MNDKLFMVVLGCTPVGRLTEQHDIFFGIGRDLKDLLPQMNAFWPDSGGLHIDAWREVTSVDGFQIDVVQKSEDARAHQLFFINLGGYRENEFDEHHYKMVTVAESMSEAIKKSKKTAFYKHCSFTGATSHIDDKYGIDVDNAYKVDDILSAELRRKFSLKITPGAAPEDQLHIGYVKFSKLLK